MILAECSTGRNVPFGSNACQDVFETVREGAGPMVPSLMYPDGQRTYDVVIDTVLATRYRSTSIQPYVNRIEPQDTPDALCGCKLPAPNQEEG